MKVTALIGEVATACREYVDARFKAMPPPVTWQGPFQSHLTYEANSLVRHGGSIWIAMIPTSTAPHAENPSWSLFLPGKP